jgi:two-component system sensor histidine kinase PilS (NtrC family)
MFEPRRVLRWIYLGRLSLASAIFLAAVFAWRAADAGITLVASLAVVSALAFTAGSIWYGMSRGPVVGRGMAYTQAVFDIALVTAVVHVTGGALSQLAALYILVTAAASLLLPVRGVLLVAGLGSAAYVGDVVLSHTTDLGLGVVLQLATFAAVALAIAYLSARLQEAGVRRDALEVELALARLQAEDILHNIRSGIITIDAKGHILFANPSAGAMLGFDSATARGRLLDELVTPRAPELAAALMRAVRTRERVTRGEGIISTGGRSFPIGLTTTTMEVDNTPGGRSATAIFQDITDGQRLQALRLRTERLEAVAELSASLAHEIKNPLASIRSAVEQLARSPRTSEDERTLSRLIVRESDRLARLLSEFLDFARVQITQGRLVDVAAVARTAANLVATHPDAGHGVAIQCDIPPGPVLVEGDEDLLHRAVFNLVLNAVQAVPAHGTVLVELSVVPPEALPAGTSFPGPAVAVHVTDNGPGIPAEIRDRVFDPFFTTKPGGTGLGLPLVHRAIEAHRGLVLVDTGPQGTRFTVLLPRRESVDAEAA